MYKQIIGRLPSVLGRSETLIHVLMISFVKALNDISHLTPDSMQKLAAKAALSALKILHFLEIAHGDISERNVLVQRTNDGYSATWVDLSSSVSRASHAILSREWKNAIEYFSQLVWSQFLELY